MPRDPPEPVVVEHRVTIPEELIMRHLDALMTDSEPGDRLHHLHVVSAPAGAIGPLGLPAESQLKTTIYAIAPTEDVDAEEFITTVILAAAAETRRDGTLALFAALNQQVWAVRPMDDLGRRLLRAGRLFEHPNVADLTVVYAACRDGRRWRGQRWLTGPRAGTSEHVDLLVGQPAQDEGVGLASAALRRLVGIGPAR